MLSPIKIGNVELKCNIFIAPLAGYTNLPTRLVYRRMGAGIAYAEMVSADGLHYNYNKSVKLIDTSPEDSPLGVQLFGSDTAKITAAFNAIKNEKFDIIDINCGCSVKKIINSRCGAYLLKEPNEIFHIIKSLKNETDKPVTLKIRSGWDHSSINYKEVYQAAESGGADLITIHPRTKSMLFNGRADWSHIADLKSYANIPVIGNGDIFTADDAVNMFSQTGCDGIMLARGVMENPFLIEEIISRLRGEIYIDKSLEEKLALAKEHCSAIVEYYNDEKKGMLEFRKFFKGYARGAAGITHLRQAVNNVLTYKDFSEVIDEFLKFRDCRISCEK